MRGLDYDLNWALAADGVTTRGSAFRNANIRTLLEFSPRAMARVTPERAAVAQLKAQADVPAFATDVVPGRKVMDVEEYEGRLDAVRLASGS